MLSLKVKTENWPVRGAFTISRGSRTEAAVVIAELSDGTHIGRGECVPYPRYGETPESVVAPLESMTDTVRDGLDSVQLQKAMPPGAARNALDCAFWDLDAKREGKRVWDSVNGSKPKPLITAFTVSLDFGSNP